MEDIQVGEYVRTKDGYIAKAIEFDINYIYTEEEISFCYENGVAIPNCFVDRKDILKHSKNIIDLIEERRLCEWKRSKNEL